MSGLTHELVYDGTTVDDVREMLLTPAFREAVCDAQRHTVARTVTVEGSTVTVDQRQDATGIPSVAKKFVGSEMHIVQVEEWSGPRGAITVTIPGKPGRITGTAELRQAGDRVVERIDLDIEVNIPLVGGKIAKMIAEKLQKTLEIEERTGRAWLAQRS